MAEAFKKAAVWLGLMSDNSYTDRDDSDEYTEEVSRAEVAESARSESKVIRPVAEASVSELESRRPTPVPVDVKRIVTLHPRTYNEARTIGEHFRDGTPVIMNLSDMEDADARRLVDFAAGLSFGLRGTIELVTRKVFLLSPNNVKVTAQDKERISEGLFNQS